MDQAHRAKYQEALTKRFIQIPIEIFFDQRLTPCDKIIYGRINTFDNFYETNGKTAELLGMSDKQVARSKRQLEALGYISKVGNDGRGMIYAANEKKLTALREQKAEHIKTCPGIIEGEKRCTCGATRALSDRTNCPNDRTNCPFDRTNCPTEYKERIKREEKEKQTKEKGDQPKQYGNADVNALLTAWAEATGFDYKNQKMERYAMAGLIKQHGLDRTRALLRLVERARRSDDRFAPQIAKPSQLRGKYSKLEALTMWAERADKNAASIPAPIIPKNPAYFYEDPDDYDTGETREEIHERCEALRAKFGFGPRKELGDE